MEVSQPQFSVAGNFDYDSDRGGVLSKPRSGSRRGPSMAACNAGRESSSSVVQAVLAQ